MKKINWIDSVPQSEAIKRAGEFWEDLSVRAYPVSHGKMRVPISLEPFTIDKESHSQLYHELTLLVSAAKKLACAFYDDPEIQELLAIDKLEYSLILNAKDEPMVGVLRVDLFYGKAPKVIEINADFPDGFFMHDVTSHAIKEHIPSFPIATESNTTLFIELLMSERVDKNDHVFIGYDAGRTFIDEFTLTQNKLIEAGWKNVSIGTLEELSFTNGVCYFHNKPVGVIRRGAELSKIRNHTQLLNGLTEAQKVSGLKIINNFKMRLLGHKSLLAALHDEHLAKKYLTSAEREVIKKLVPQTKKLHPDDLNDLKTEKDRWVLKPSDLAEGNGVVVGTSCPAREWEIALRTALEQPGKWVIQEKIDIPSTTFSLLDPGTNKIVSQSRYYDFDPHIVLLREKTEFGNILARFSESEILNVMKGGGLTYVFHTP